MNRSPSGATASERGSPNGVSVASIPGTAAPGSPLPATTDTSPWESMRNTVEFTVATNTPPWSSVAIAQGFIPVSTAGRPFGSPPAIVSRIRFACPDAGGIATVSTPHAARTSARTWRCEASPASRMTFPTTPPRSLDRAARPCRGRGCPCRAPRHHQRPLPGRILILTEVETASVRVGKASEHLASKCSGHECSKPSTSTCTRASAF